MAKEGTLTTYLLSFIRGSEEYFVRVNCLVGSVFMLSNIWTVLYSFSRLARSRESNLLSILVRVNMSIVMVLEFSLRSCDLNYCWSWGSV